MNTLSSPAALQACCQPASQAGHRAAVPTKRFRIPAPRFTHATARKGSNVSTPAAAVTAALNGGKGAAHISPAAAGSEAATGGKQDDLRAIVIGGGLAGLTAAQALCQLFDQVTLVERDAVSTSSGIVSSDNSNSLPAHIQEVLGTSRPGVPQFSAPHAILRRGITILSELFGMDFCQVFVDAGATPINWLRDVDIYSLGRQRKTDIAALAPAEVEEACGVAGTRLLYESIVRREVVQRNQNLHFVSGVAAHGLQFADNNKIVTGLHLGNGITMEADLVVDASGRNSKTPKWLGAAGRDVPPVETASSGAGYGSRYYKLKPGMQDSGRVDAVFDNRGGVLWPIEHDIYQIVMHGYRGDHPPSDDAGYLNFAQSLPGEPHMYQRLQNMEPLTPVLMYKSCDNRRQRYDMIDMPEGIVVLGDAVATFNPIYGQGMTVGLIAVEALRDLIAGKLEAAESRSGADRRTALVGLPQRFQKRLLELTKTPWNMATSEDMKRTGGKVESINPVSRLLTRYTEYMVAMAATETAVQFQMWKVQHLVDDPSVLLSPRMMATAATFWLRARLAAAQALLFKAGQKEPTATSGH